MFCRLVYWLVLNGAKNVSIALKSDLKAGDRVEVAPPVHASFVRSQARCMAPSLEVDLLLKLKKNKSELGSRLTAS